MAKISINLATGSLQKEEIIVGIDLGTTNSLIAFIDPDKNPKVINDTGKGLLVPSIVHFNAAGDILVGNEAREFLITDPANTIFSVKRLLGRSYKDVAGYQDTFSYQLIDDNNDSLVKIQTGSQFYTPVELSAEILKELKHRAEHALKTPVNKALINCSKVCLSSVHQMSPNFSLNKFWLLNAFLASSAFRRSCCIRIGLAFVAAVSSLFFSIQ